MDLCLNELLCSISTGLDMVESELLGSSANHGKRTAMLSIAMGKTFAMEKDTLFALSACALLHDNALTESIVSVQPSHPQTANLRTHCVLGQNNMAHLPLRSDIEGFVLYHHERADGTGPFGLYEGKIPLGAELIALADAVDTETSLWKLPLSQLEKIRKSVASRAGTQFTQRAVNAFLQVFTIEMLTSLQNNHIHNTFAAAMPRYCLAASPHEMVRLASAMARIIDYKSRLTLNHSLQVAHKAWWMGGFYQLDKESRAKLYLAAALHDIGKLKLPTAILEKTEKLTGSELSLLRSHVEWTHAMLKDIHGFEDICRWASNHHERLDKSGYPRGIGGSDLDFNSRLLAVIDLYQAIREERSYHKGSTHAQTMDVLWAMADNGCIDESIVNDIDREMASFSNGIFPPPSADIRVRPH